MESLCRADNSFAMMMLSYRRIMLTGLTPFTYDTGGLGVRRLFGEHPTPFFAIYFIEISWTCALGEPQGQCQPSVKR